MTTFDWIWYHRMINSERGGMLGGAVYCGVFVAEVSLGSGGWCPLFVLGLYRRVEDGASGPAGHGAWLRSRCCARTWADAAT